MSKNNHKKKDNIVTFFSTEKQLSKLTGLNHEQLWDAGFDLDDWDWGFCCEPGFENHPYSQQILKWMEGYCCGYEKTNYNGLDYYILYHS